MKDRFSNAVVAATNRCPKCDNTTLLWFEHPCGDIAYVCLMCVPSAARELRQMNVCAYPFLSEVPGYSAGPAPVHAEHSPLSEPLSVEDMLYEVLGYYS